MYYHTLCEQPRNLTHRIFFPFLNPNPNTNPYVLSLYRFKFLPIPNIIITSSEALQQNLPHATSPQCAVDGTNTLAESHLLASRSPHTVALGVGVSRVLDETLVKRHIELVAHEAVHSGRAVAEVLESGGTLAGGEADAGLADGGGDDGGELVGPGDEGGEDVGLGGFGGFGEGFCEGHEGCFGGDAGALVQGLALGGCEAGFDGGEEFLLLAESEEGSG